MTVFYVYGLRNWSLGVLLFCVAAVPGLLPVSHTSSSASKPVSSFHPVWLYPKCVLRNSSTSIW